MKTKKSKVYIGIILPLLFTLFFSPIFVLSQTTSDLSNLQSIDCSQYMNSNEKLMCGYFNMLVQILRSYLVLLSNKTSTFLNQQSQLSIQNPIKIFYPNGGEKLELGKTYLINWEQSKNADVYIALINKKLSPLSNTGISYYSKLISSFSGQKGKNNYYWTIDNSISFGDDYQICISGYFGDESNIQRPVLFENCSNSFSIISSLKQPFINLISNPPADNSGNVTIKEGDIINISGTPLNVNLSVYDIDFTRAFFFDNNILNCTNNSANEKIWTLNCLGKKPGTTNVYVEIYKNNKTYSSNIISVNVVKVDSYQTIKIKSPLSNQTLNTGQTYTGTFSWNGFTPKSLYVYLLSKTVESRNILSYIGSLSASAGDRNFNFTIPSSITPGDYVLGVCDEGTKDFYNKDLSLCNWIEIKVQSPIIQKKFYFIDPIGSRGGLDISPGNYYNVKWDSIGFDKFNLYLCTIYNQCKFIAIVNANDKSYNWYVDPNHPYFPGYNLRLKLEDVSDSNMYIYSGYFNVYSTSSSIQVSQPTIQISSPVRGQTLNTGQTYTGTFSWNGFTPKSLYVYLLSKTVESRNILSYIGSLSASAGDRNFNFTIPSSITPGDYVLGVCDEGTKDFYNKDLSLCNWIEIKVQSLVSTNLQLYINKTYFINNDTWQLTLINAAPNKPVTICAIDNKGVQSCTPAFNLGLIPNTDSNGNWTASGNWRGDDSILGTWTEWIEVDGKKSNSVTFTITVSTTLNNKINNLANILNSLSSIINIIKINNY